MTPLRKPVRRLLELELITERGRTRPIVIEARREGLALRQLGTRTVYLLPWRVAYTVAARRAADDLRRQRAQERARRRSLRGAA